MAQAKTTNSEKATGAATYKKEQLVASKRYANRRDIIMALLEDGKAIFDVLRCLGVTDVGFNQPQGMLYPTENPFA